MRFILKPSCRLLTPVASLLWVGVVIVTAADAPANGPAVLPGKGLAEHDFFYAGEAKEERMFIIRKGEIVWSHTHPGKGEISDAVLLPNGHVLFAHQFGITDINPEKEGVWNLDATTIQVLDGSPSR
jgi:hypothetical protein